MYPTGVSRCTEPREVTLRIRKNAKTNRPLWAIERVEWDVVVRRNRTKEGIL